MSKEVVKQAKKALKKKVAKKTRPGIEYIPDARVMMDLQLQLMELNQRLDRIVKAISSAKSIKGF